MDLHESKRLACGFSETPSIEVPAAKRARSVFILIAVAALLLVSGVIGCGSVPAAWVAADASTLRTAGKEWQKYYRADKGLTDAQKKRRDRKMRAWRARVKEAQKGMN